MGVDVIADGADRRTGMMGGTQQRQRLRGRPSWLITVLDAMVAAASSYVLAQQLPGLRIE